MIQVSDFGLIIRGGAVVDGSGAEPRRADVAVAGDRVVALGELTGESADREIDATDRLVFPGFIDAHSHADVLLTTPLVQQAYLRQGVTTVIVGQDGVSFAPTDAGSIGYPSRYFAAINGPSPDGFASGVDIKGLLDRLDGAGALNAGCLVPAGTLRARYVGPANERATPAQLGAMGAALERAMAEGALGLSTGLDYVPGAFADVAELAALCVPVARAGGVYVSHVRGYAADTIRDALDEAAQISQLSGAAAHISHLHGPADSVELALDSCRTERGVTLTFDSYPYLRGATLLAMLALPAQLQAGGIDATLERLGQPAVREQLRREWLPANERLASVTLSFLGAPSLRWAEGLPLYEAARRSGNDLADFICDSLISCDLAIGGVVDNGADRTEADLRELLRHPEQMASSDAIFLGSRPHPRGWGAFARLLARHVRELGDWSWGEAALHLSGNAARRFGLDGRGSISSGSVADLVVLDPRTVRDNATYDEPTTLATGVSQVVVGGQLVLDRGELTGSRVGRALR